MIVGFDDAFELLIGNEGGYSNDPQDPGGETMWGITARVARAHGYTDAMRDLPLAIAKAIAKAEYWDRYQCDQYSAAIAFHVFDAAYNGGHPATWLQQAIGTVTVDGEIGAATIGALRASNPDYVIRRFGALRQLYLTDLAGFGHDGRGWMKRLAHNQLNV